ncbi:MAG TPA: adenylate/guanylate cyclase domain-containing protein [Mycobacteriales bacterium]|nr:adenylate/guanylate cyclase domain-containing protein [Mycobacteriales bacterium]
MVPETHYAMSGQVSIAYQVFGGGDRDLVLSRGYATHLDLDWDSALWTSFADGLGSFARVITYDKRGTGLSDRVSDVPTLEERIDDVRAVMDAAGIQRATQLGISEGAPLSLLFAATHPERVESLVLYGGMARSTWAPDYPWATGRRALLESAQTFLAPQMYTGTDIEIWMPSHADDLEMQRLTARYRRAAASPDAMLKLFLMFLEVDVRHVLPTIHQPTLVIHRRGDRVVNRGAGRFLSENIEGARYVELPGQDHLPWAGDAAAIVGEIREFLTGSRGPAPEPDRMLATVLFTDIVDSTGVAVRLGDQAWRGLLERYQSMVATEVTGHRGRKVKSLGDGTLATFDGPGRAIACARAATTLATGLGLQVRTGLHCGEVEVMGDDVGGIAVHLAARVCAAAEPDEVLVTSTVKDLVAGSGVAFTDRGTPLLKGMDRPWQCWAVDPR